MKGSNMTSLPRDSSRLGLKSPPGLASRHCGKCARRTSVQQAQFYRSESDLHRGLKASDTDDSWPTDAELDAAQQQYNAALNGETADESYHSLTGPVEGHISADAHVLAADRSLSTEFSIPQPQFLQPAPLMPSPLTDPAGFVWSMVLLITIRLSRRYSEMSPFSAESQNISEEALINDQQLFSSRQAYERQTAAARAAEADERLERARDEAAAKEAERLTRMQQRDDAKAAAKARADELAAAKRAKFEEAEAASAAVLAEKTAVAQKEREERERLRQQELDQLQREEEEQELLAALEARAEERRQREEAAAVAAAEEAERQRLQRLSRRFVLRLEGSVSVTKPPKGTMTPGRMPVVALLQLSAAFGSTVGGQSGTAVAAFASFDAAHEGAIAVTGAAARAAAGDFASAVRLQAMTGSGALQAMDEYELQLWVYVATARTIAAAQPQMAALIDGSSTRVIDRTKDVQVGTERFVLPENQPQQFAARANAAAAALHERRTSDASMLLDGLVEDEERLFYQGLPEGTPPHLAAAAALASFVDRASEQQPSSAAAAASFARSHLAALTAGAPLDSLAPWAVYMEAILADGHLVAAIARDLSEKNMSPAIRREMKNRRLAEEAALAEALVQEEWPDASESAAARVAQREATTPIPERVWALRNVAATSALGGPAGAARAVQLLQQALQLKEEDLGDSSHPCLLPELEAMADAAASAGPELRDAETQARERSLRIFSYIAARYKAVGHVGSGVVVLEAAIRHHEERLERRHRGVTALNNTADRWLEGLHSDTRAQVIAKRRDNSTVPAIAVAFTDELAAHASLGSQLSKAQQWQAGGIAPLKPLIEIEV